MSSYTTIDYEIGKVLDKTKRKRMNLLKITLTESLILEIMGKTNLGEIEIHYLIWSLLVEDYNVKEVL